MDVEKFKHDLERTPFHIASIFEEPDDQLWVWERLFDDISNEHAPWREIKVRSFSSTNESGTKLRLILEKLNHLIFPPFLMKSSPLVHTRILKGLPTPR